jgi:hypothetical protein
MKKKLFSIKTAQEGSSPEQILVAGWDPILKLEIGTTPPSSPDQYESRAGKVSKGKLGALPERMGKNSGK